MMIPKKRFNRFALVGLSNALLHFIVLNSVFYMLGFGKLTSSIIATIVAMTYSFYLNRNFVFGDHEGNTYKQIVLFVIITITITGMLFIHNIVYLLSLQFLYTIDNGMVTIAGNLGIDVNKDFIDINLSTVIGAIFAMFWNYNGYRMFVFRDNKTDRLLDEEV